MSRADEIRNILANRSVSFAGISYSTIVATAAKHRDRRVEKLVTANVQLFSNIKAATRVFQNAVRKSASNIAGNDLQNVAEYKPQDTYYSHTDCYSIVEHKTNGKQYLYCIFNSSTSEYLIDHKPATKEEVAELLTPSAAKALLNPKPIKNKTYNIEHNVQVRTIALDNIISITANKQTIDF